MSRYDLARGNCYEYAATALLGFGRAGAEEDNDKLEAFGEQLVLVHGYPTLSSGDQEGEQYGHAWIEIGGRLVWDPVVDQFLPRDLYYWVGQVNEEECMLYPASVVDDRLDDEDTWGPWGAVPGSVIWNEE